MRGKQLLKRLVFGPLTALPPELEDGPAAALIPLGVGAAAPEFKILYALGRV